MKQIFIIVWTPYGSRTQIGVAQCFDYEVNQYDRASRQQFATEKGAQEYCLLLAERHDLQVKDVPKFLD